jgi:hypothetical protein
MMRDLTLLKKLPVQLDFLEKYIHKEGFKEWLKKLQEIGKISILRT